ncbi:3'-5' exonuclease [Corynebacterium pygosceleis]|uniref:3'-5' exonuclease n=1 Tax=Corynebacterium pygosceleis TaxID=2800406 RepID=A0A9Q4C8K9_9CORY|nr:3'-5' exonuclease [Corynebacterium pygosceleis]MCK7637894.1 3'-5' exonuclease [Corynebacterium pygosceleis]MCK7675609.1 3'-5' exonuclease [Corynebacterium pygosceleis]MCL0120997.1 3'-5' exonuclease [Corynebacterium pygosceleis]MCX7444567.1 3'-5' exonuclease [Corynebacterium pygosceleis]MCX7468610.1 3'-5' exonuclease [Corynebacterium pygosceleis]
MTNFDPSAMLSFDLETTSANPVEARIVTSAMVHIKGGNVDPVELLADPGVEIPAQASEIHGITTEYAREHGRPHDEVLAETVERIRRGWAEGLTLIVFNAAYDLTVLRTLTGDFTVTGPVFDPYVIDRAKDPYRKGRRTLGSLCEHYKVRLDNAHEATSDAVAAARVAWMQARKWPELVSMDSDELMENQAVWHHTSQTSLRRYFEGRGRDASDISTSWPMRG